MYPIGMQDSSLLSIEKNMYDVKPKIGIPCPTNRIIGFTNNSKTKSQTSRSNRRKGKRKSKH
jgi:hypothetical protein